MRQRHRVVGALRRALAGCGLALALLAAATAAGAIEINTATRAELERLDGIGVVLAERILVERDKRAFASWEDLAQRVKGLRGARLQRLQGQGATVNGLAGAPAGRAEQKKP